MKDSKKNLSALAGKALSLLGDNKYVLLVLLVGIAIILWPAGSSPSPTPESPETIAADVLTGFSLAEQEEKIAGALSQISGAGKVTVVLSLKTSLEQEVAVDEDSSGNRETVIVSQGSGTQSEVTVRYIYPQYLGALVVCQGADDAAVKLQVTQAVAALTGLGTDKITVSKMTVSE